MAEKGLFVSIGDHPHVTLREMISWQTRVSFIGKMGANSTYITALLQGLREIIQVKSSKERKLVIAVFNKDFTEDVDCLEVGWITGTACI